MSYNFNLEPKKVPLKHTKYVKICTEIPSKESVEIIKSCMESEPSSMNDQLPVVWDHAKDFQVWDRSGNCWIDFTSTIFVANMGHANEKVKEAILNTVNKDLLNAYYYPTKERAEYTNFLLKNTFLEKKKVLLLSTGSEATEAAIKIAMLYGQIYAKGKRKYVLSFENGFHGKTMGAQMAGGKQKEKQWIGWQHPNIVNIPYPYPWVLEKLGMTGKEFFYQTMADLGKKQIYSWNIAGIILEPYQGWCAIFPPRDYVQTMIREFSVGGYPTALGYKTLIIIDEVQAGFGRTGNMFGFEHLMNNKDVDIVCCGKGISSSLPLSAVIAEPDLLDLSKSFNSTHGGNPVAVAAAHASLKELVKDNRKLLREVTEKGLFLEKLLLNWQKEQPEYVKNIYCKGLLAGVFIEPGKFTTITKEDFVDELIEIAMQKGLLSVRTGSGTLKIGPPLTIPIEALQEGIEILKESLNELVAKYHEFAVIKIRHFGINVANMKKSLEFYVDMLGFEIKQQYTDDSHYINKLSNLTNAKLHITKLYRQQSQTGIELIQYEFTNNNNNKEAAAVKNDVTPVIYQSGGLHLAIQVDSIDNIYKKLQLIGIKTLSEPLESPEGAKVFFCFDPDGTRLEFVEIKND